MGHTLEQLHRDLISGQRRGPAAAVLLGILRGGELFYSAATRLRNWCFDRGVFPADAAPRPVVCVGNITTGGTGKTPVVRWLAERLRQAGHRPAILLRGYKQNKTGGSDEQRMLHRLLQDASTRPIPVIAGANRLRAAERALKLDPQIDLFILDDGFQHRKLQRNFDLVLIDSTNPFGYEHQLPRGLLREALRGLRRASALVLTRSDAVSSQRQGEIEATLRRHNSWVPLYRCSHVHRAFVDDQNRPAKLEPDAPALVFCGIGNPDSFVKQLTSGGIRCVAHRFFGDHHAYSTMDVEGLQSAAVQAGAQALITTEKDWVKLERVVADSQQTLPILRVQLDVQFHGDDGRQLLDQIRAAMKLAEPATAPLPER